MIWKPPACRRFVLVRPAWAHSCGCKSRHKLVTANEAKRNCVRATFKQRIRQLTRRSGGRGMTQAIERLRPCMLGWKAYFGLPQTPRVWRERDKWLRHRLRAIQLKQCRRGTTLFREPRALGASHDVAQRIAANSRRWRRNSGKLLNSVLTLAWFDRLGLPRLA